MSNSTLIETDYREIPLTNSKQLVLVDKRDYDYLMNWKWRQYKRKTSQGISLRVGRFNGKKTVYLHHEILIRHFYLLENAHVEYKNGNWLDNRLKNLLLKVSQVSRLTPRLQKVAALVTSGLTNREIASWLSISEKTVAHHLSDIFRILDISNRTELAYHVMQNVELLETDNLLPWKSLQKNRSGELVLVNCLNFKQKLKLTTRDFYSHIKQRLIKEEKLKHALDLSAEIDEINSQIASLQEKRNSLQLQLQAIKP